MYPGRNLDSANVYGERRGEMAISPHPPLPTPTHPPSSVVDCVFTPYRRSVPTFYPVPCPEVRAPPLIRSAAGNSKTAARLKEPFEINFTQTRNHSPQSLASRSGISNLFFYALIPLLSSDTHMHASSTQIFLLGVSLSSWLLALGCRERRAQLKICAVSLIDVHVLRTWPKSMTSTRGSVHRQTNL